MQFLKQYLIAIAVFVGIGLLLALWAWHSEQIENLKTTQFAAGQDECKTAVENTKNQVLQEATAKLVKKEAEFSRALFAAQQAAKDAEKRVAELKGVAKGQHEELNAQGADLQCVIPDATIDTLNRPIRIGAGAPPLPVPKKEVGAQPAAPAAPSAPPKGGDLPFFLKPTK